MLAMEIYLNSIALILSNFVFHFFFQFNQTIYAHMTMCQNITQVKYHILISESKYCSRKIELTLQFLFLQSLQFVRVSLPAYPFYLYS